MSLTTRCPACGTMFKVVPDQLKISDGWVRCGHCSDVFDAMLNLQTETAPVAVTSPPVATQTPAATSTTGAGGSRVVIRRTPIAAPPPTPLPPAPPAPPPPPPPPPPAPASLADSVAVSAAAQTPYVQQPSVVPPPPQDATAAPLTSPAHAPVATFGDQGWAFVNRPGEDEPGDAVKPVVAAGGEPPTLDQSAGDDWDGEWLLSPSSMSRHREAVAQELQSPGGQTQPPPPSVDNDFARELDAFAGMAKAANVPQTAAEGNDERPGKNPEAVGANTGDSIWPKSLPGEVVDDEGLDAEPEEPTFVVRGRREAFWRSPAVRTALLLLAVALGALLGLQWASHERDQLAARYPAMEPYLKSLCAATGCSLAAPRRIDAVAIDSSTLTRKLGQFYSFDLVVKNSDSMAVAMPALELSLTDSRDKEIARRVFLPEEMPGSPTVVPAHGTLSVNMRLSLAESDLSSMAGYRALVFYP